MTSGLPGREPDGGAVPPVGQLLLRLRVAAGLTQEELAERAGVSSRSVRDIERGRVTRPRLDTVRLLAVALELDPADRNRLQRAARARPPGSLPAARRPELRVGAPAGPAQLPSAVGGFTGRLEQLAALDAHLDPEHAAAGTAISVLSGPPGVGKSALAVQWGQRARHRFPDGQLYLDLRGWSAESPLRPAQALAQFLRALGVPGEDVPPGPDESAALYRSRLAGRRILVVLDNARSPDQVRPLLPGGPGSAVVITSRDALAGLVATDGAHPIQVAPLPDGEAIALLERMLGRERVAAEPAAAAELARLCGRLPLALRIAAARLRRQPVSGLAAYCRLLAEGDRMAELQIEGDDEAAVAKAFGLSYQALTPASRQLFRLLGLLPGRTVTVPAAAALADLPPEQARDALTELATAHLADVTGDGYLLHDLIRLYAADRCGRECTRSERRLALHRLMDHVLGLVSAAAAAAYPEMVRLPLPDHLDAADAAAGQPGFDSPEQALQWLDANGVELLGTAQAAQHAGHPAGWLIADALRGYVLLRPHAQHRAALPRTAQLAARTAGDLAGQASAELTIGQLASRQDRYQEAIQHLDRARRQAAEAGWVAGRAVATRSLGNTYRLAGDLGRAEPLLDEAARLHRELGSTDGEAAARYNLGMVAHERGDLEAAVRCYRLALRLQESGPQDVTAARASILVELGDAYRGLGRTGPAREVLTEGLQLARTLRDRARESYTLRCLAEMNRDLGDHELAGRQAADALAVARDAGDRRVQAQCLQTLASIDGRRGRPEQAARRHEEARRLAEETGDGYTAAEAQLGLALLELAAGDTGTARQHAGGALRAARAAGYRELQERAELVLDPAGDDRGEGPEAGRA